MSNNKVQLKNVLSAIDNGNTEFYENLTEEERKSLSLWVLMRYASSNQNHPEHFLLLTNEFVNVHHSTLKNHPELLWKLLTIPSIGKNTFHPWIKPGKKKRKDKLLEALSNLYPTYKDDDLELLKTINSEKELKEIFKSAGYSDKEIKDIFK